jgi:hypothetical protein
MKKLNLFLIIMFGLTQLVYSQIRLDNVNREKEHRAVKELINSKIIEQQRKNVKLNPAMNKPYFEDFLLKVNGQADRKSFLMNGNRITTGIFNYGGIGPGFGLLRNINNFVWKDLGYVFQFGPIVGAQVHQAGSGKKLHIISDGLHDYTSPLLQEVNPTGDTLWQWQPLPGYAEPDQPNIASNPAPDSDGDGKPDSWPRSWYSSILGRYVWPGFLSQNSTNADLEVYWAMDDRDNKEFKYYPFENNHDRRGLGIQVDARAFQWSNSLAENTIFFVYTITNVSEKRLDSVFFGIYGDPDLGGGSPENTDDNGFFVPPYSLDSVDVSNIPVYARSMVYFWDPDMKGNFGLPLGYLGCKFLESPGNPVNGIDDDGDGMIDESQEDGIDNDGDWNPLIHDVGLDGIANTGDEGEGDGIPTAGKTNPDGSPDALYPGEPNFEFTDLDESDQIGLTSFNSWTWNQDKISNDESMWNRCVPRNFSNIQQNSDIVFIFGSGYISLAPGETKRISMALLCGDDLDDLLTSAEIVQTIYNQNYQFFKPPLTPNVTAVPDDKKVTLYWDTIAEESVDPITGKDFEGYVIYRSTDPSFEDIKKITDGKGTTFLNEPLKDANGNEAKWDIDFRDEPFVDANGNGQYDNGESFTDWDNDKKWTANVEDPWQGYHPVPYKKRGIQYYLGNNSGLVHKYIDTNNVINGQTYYYAVVAYDHGDSVGIPPTETTKKITVDPITSLLTFDDNTVQVIPGPRASGYVTPLIKNNNTEHTSGIGTGDIIFKVLNDLNVKNNGEYELSFADSMKINGIMTAKKNYSLLNKSAISDTLKVYGTNYTQSKKMDISKDEFFEVKGIDGTKYTEGVDYVFNYERGAIARTSTSAIPDQSKLILTYRYFPVSHSTLLKNEDANPVFDGVHLTVNDADELAWDKEKSKWAEGSSNYEFAAHLSTVGVKRVLYPGDYEIKFSSNFIDSAYTFSGTLKKIPVRYSVTEIATGVPRKVITFVAEKPATKNETWDPGEELICFKPGKSGTITSSDTLTWGIEVKAPLDTSVTPIAPKDGDVLLIKTKRPFNKIDKFILRTEGGKISTADAKARLNKIYVVPNPYVGYNSIEPTNKLPGQSRGEKRIYFENLPSKCTIRIFTLSGDPVAELNHESMFENGREYWNLLNYDGFGVAYGVYIAHIDAPGVGERIVKFALIK